MNSVQWEKTDIYVTNDEKELLNPTYPLVIVTQYTKCGAGNWWDWPTPTVDHPRCFKCGWPYYSYPKKFKGKWKCFACRMRTIDNIVKGIGFLFYMFVLGMIIGLIYIGITNIFPIHP